MESLLLDLLLVGREVGSSKPGAWQRVVHREDGRVVWLVGAPRSDCVQAGSQRVEVWREGRVVGGYDREASLLEVDHHFSSRTVRLVLERCKLPSGSCGLRWDGVVEKGNVLVAAILLENPLLAGIRHCAIGASRLP